MKNITKLILIQLFLLATSGYAITFNLTFEDVNNSTGFGFDDPTEGALRRSTATAVLNYIDSVFDATGSADIRFELSNNAPGSGTLASAGAFYFPNQGTSNGFVFEHATTGTDPTGSQVDGIVQFNFGRVWNSGLDAPTTGEFDLFSVLLHEFTHALGFSSLIESDGSHSITGTRGVFDTFLVEGAGTPTPVIDGGGNFIGDAGTRLTSGNLFFDGPNARAANGGNPIEMYAPDPFEDGSSVSHIASAFPAVMNPSIASGVQRRTYTDLDLAILQDIGWTLAAVPEPSTYFLLFLVGIFYSYRSRKKNIA